MLMIILKKGWRADAGESNFLEQQSEAALVTSARLFTSDLLSAHVYNNVYNKVYNQVYIVHCTTKCKYTVHRKQVHF